MQIFICGLPRSGTTITWKTLAQDKRFASYDEPFSEFREELPELDMDKTNSGYLDLFNKNPKEFRSYCTSIPPSQYMSKGFTDAQVRYIKWLVGHWKNVNIDFVRCNFKLEHLRTLFPNAIIIHLSRKAPAFVSSHITHSHRTPGIYAFFARHYRRLTFFLRKKSYNFYNLEEAIDTHFSKEIEQVKSKTKGIKDLPLNKCRAYQKLLLLHKYNRIETEKFGNKYPELYMQWQFESFLASPEKHLRELYGMLNMEYFNFDLTHLRKANRGYKPENKKWKEVL